MNSEIIWPPRRPPTEIRLSLNVEELRQIVRWGETPPNPQESFRFVTDADLKLSRDLHEDLRSLLYDAVDTGED